MIRLTGVVFALAVALSAAGAQETPRVASPGKYRFSGTIASSAEVSGWFEVDIKGVLWLSDGDCVPRGLASSHAACTIKAVWIRRVRSAYQLDVVVDVLMRRSTGGGTNAPGVAQRISGTLTARRA